jgi:hypothetical protein
MSKSFKTIASAVVAVGAAALVSGAAATVGAQPTSATSARTTPSLAPSATRRVAVNPAEQAASVRTVVQRGSVLTQRLSQMLEEARREADIIRVTCLNDKLTQANANMRTAQSRLGAFENATDPEQKSHEATVLNVLGQKFQLLDQEANRCVGQDMYETGSTKVLTEIDTALLPFEEDATEPPPPPAPAVPILPLDASGVGG